jgi:hypothetical protein
MDMKKSIIEGQDRILLRRMTPRLPGAGSFAVWKRAMATWFRSSGLEVGQAGLERVTSWLVPARRCQPILVVVTARYPAMKRPDPRGMVVRI